MSAASVTPRLVRQPDCLVSGVAGGLAEHLAWPVAAVRLAFLATGLLGGAGLLLYLWLWAFTPWATDAADQPIIRRAPVSWMLVVASGIFAFGLVVVSWQSGEVVGPRRSPRVPWELSDSRRPQAPGRRSSIALTRPEGAAPSSSCASRHPAFCCCSPSTAPSARSLGSRPTSSRPCCSGSAGSSPRRWSPCGAT